MKKLLTGMLLMLLLASAWSASTFTVRDIRLEGLQRISAGTVFTYLPIRPGDTVGKSKIVEAIRSLYKTGFFKDVQVEREADVLVIFVAERPAINDIVFEGNSDIPKEQLEEALKQIGLVKGRVFNRSLLDKLNQELQRQYYSLGKYAVKIESSITPLERNRVNVVIKIAEGESAEIYQVNIIGNHAYTDEKVISLLSLADPSFFGSRNNYQKQQLAADLENLKSYYLDRGYINFNINSTQVSLSPNKESVYISINLSEGEQYTISDIKLAGELVFPLEEMQKLVTYKSGDVFSRKEIAETSKQFRDKLAEEGYAFANVNMVPDIDKTNRTIKTTYFIEPGQRVYVRKIYITGNKRTKDEVIRRELRQLESARMSSTEIALSRSRLDRLGFFDSVTVETRRVPGSIDEVDLHYHVVERPTGSLQAGIGYSDSQGMTINFALTQENFMGTGKRVGINLDNSDVSKTYSFNYTNPYYTPEGVSRGFSLSYREINADEAQISNYSTDSYGASLFYNVPLSEYSGLSYGLRFDNTTITLGATGVSQDISDFVTQFGEENTTYQLTGSWYYDSRNKRIFATEGFLTRLSAEVAVPGADLEYYKVGAQFLKYFPFGKEVSLAANLNLGYGDSYGDTTTRLPPYENYFAGGSRTIRGYRGNSLGPKDSDLYTGGTDDPVGGNIKAIMNLDLILPNPLSEQSNSTRISLFVDGGNVFRDRIDSEEFRYTAGLSFIWLTPVGAMRFNFSSPLNEKTGDSTESFQFSLGSPF